MRDRIKNLQTVRPGRSHRLARDRVSVGVGDKEKGASDRHLYLKRPITTIRSTFEREHGDDFDGAVLRDVDGSGGLAHARSGRDDDLRGVMEDVHHIVEFLQV
jgi:hypothetical protein